MTVIEAIVQGAIQGATEFLPVSSSGHLALSQHVLGVQVDSLLFDVMLHLGTLLAVAVVYRRLLWRLMVAGVQMGIALLTGKFRWSQRTDDQNLLLLLAVGLLPLFLLFVPVPGTGAQVRDFADRWATDNDLCMEGAALLMTSLLLFLGNWAARRRERTQDYREQYRFRDALLVGVAQCAAAVFPGLSRSGSTLSVGLLCGIRRQKALDYSFVLGVPAILAAVVLSAKEAVHEPAGVEAAPLLAGVLTAAAVGFLAMKLFQWMVVSDKTRWFVWYTLLLGIAALITGILEQVLGIHLFPGMPR